MTRLSSERRRFLDGRTPPKPSRLKYVQTEIRHPDLARKKKTDGQIYLKRGLKKPGMIENKC